MSLAVLPGLQIDSPLTRIDAPNFKPTHWPPANDFPVTIDPDGNVVSRYGDVRWDLSPWAGYTLSIHFGDGPGQGRKLSPENASLLRQIVAWWLWGEAAIRSVRSLVNKFDVLKPLFVACTDSNITVTELRKYPKVIERLSNYYRARAYRLIDLLHSLSLAESILGFSILDKNGIKHLSGILPDIESTQTAYIPVRIWTYQVSRLRECLDDFIAKKESIEACYEFCLEAYAAGAGGNLSDAFGIGGRNRSFQSIRALATQRSGKILYDSFYEIAKQFEIDKLLDKWVVWGSQSRIVSLSSYLSLISMVGLAYTLNFSLMRVSEGAMLRAHCHEVEQDKMGNDIHIIRGVTTDN